MDEKVAFGSFLFMRESVGTLVQSLDYLPPSLSVFASHHKSPSGSTSESLEGGGGCQEKRGFSLTILVFYLSCLIFKMNK